MGEGVEFNLGGLSDSPKTDKNIKNDCFRLLCKKEPNQSSDYRVCASI